jgi:hypothetical protein
MTLIFIIILPNIKGAALITHKEKCDLDSLFVNQVFGKNGQFAIVPFIL